MAQDEYCDETGRFESDYEWVSIDEVKMNFRKFCGVIESSPNEAHLTTTCTLRWDMRTNEVEVRYSEVPPAEWPAPAIGLPGLTYPGKTKVCIIVYMTNTTKKYIISVPSGKYTIDLDNESCAYDAFEHFLDNDLTTGDNEFLRNVENFDVYNFITIIK